MQLWGSRHPVAWQQRCSPSPPQAWRPCSTLAAPRPSMHCTTCWLAAQIPPGLALPALLACVEASALCLAVTRMVTQGMGWRLSPCKMGRDQLGLAGWLPLLGCPHQRVCWRLVCGQAAGSAQLLSQQLALC